MSNNGSRNTDIFNCRYITEQLLEKLKYQQDYIDDDDKSSAKEQLEGLVDVLKSKKQVVLHGPPGVGKTQFMVWLADAVAGDTNRVKLVQFHESYSYDHFVQGCLPRIGDANQAGFQLKDGPFLEWFKKARKHPTNNYVLAIDEMNRANLANVFGELFMSLERKEGYTPELVYSQEKIDLRSVPNLYIIACLNDADRALGDSIALRRRFHYFECPACGFHTDTDPDIQSMECRGLLLLAKGMLERTWPKAFQNSARKLEEAIGNINRSLARDEIHGKSLAQHLAVGPSYFIEVGAYIQQHAKVEEITRNVIRVWHSSVYPYLLATFHGERTNPVELTEEFCKVIEGEFHAALGDDLDTFSRNGAQEADITAADGAQEADTTENLMTQVELAKDAVAVADDNDKKRGRPHEQSSESRKKAHLEQESNIPRDVGDGDGALQEGRPGSAHSDLKAWVEKYRRKAGFMPLPEAFDELTELDELDLSGNKLTELPSNFGMLEKLDELDLSGNKLTELPSSFGKLTALQTLDLSHNQLTRLPDEIGELRSLSLLNLFYNELGEMPSTFGKLKNLQWLNLSGNKQLFAKIDDALPSTFGDLPKLKWLNLTGTNVKSLPWETMKKLNSSLRFLYLAHNSLTEVPDKISELTELQDLDLGDNPSLKGKLEALQGLTSLKALRLNKTKFDTELEIELRKVYRKLKTHKLIWRNDDGTWRKLNSDENSASQKNNDDGDPTGGERVDNADDANDVYEDTQFNINVINLIDAFEDICWNGPPGGFVPWGKLTGYYQQSYMEENELGDLYVKETRRVNERDGKKRVDRFYIMWRQNQFYFDDGFGNGEFINFKQTFSDDGKGDGEDRQCFRSETNMRKYLTFQPEFKTQALLQIPNHSALEKMTCRDLENKLRDCGLKPKGSKSDLVDRLAEMKKKAELLSSTVKVEGNLTPRSKDTDA